MDQDIVDDLIVEIEEIKQELLPLIDDLKADLSILTNFEKCGLLIDRIYGTVITMGMNNFGEYTGLLKEICYACAQSSRTDGRARVLALIEGTIINFDKFSDFLKNPKDKEKLEDYKRILNIEKSRAQNLIKTVYYQIKNVPK